MTRQRACYKAAGKEWAMSGVCRGHRKTKLSNVALPQLSLSGAKMTADMRVCVCVCLCLRHEQHQPGSRQSPFRAKGNSHTPQLGNRKRALKNASRILKCSHSSQYKNCTHIDYKQGSVWHIWEASSLSKQTGRGDGDGWLARKKGALPFTLRAPPYTSSASGALQVGF